MLKSKSKFQQYHTHNKSIKPYYTPHGINNQPHTWYDPIEVSVLHLLIVLVLMDVEVVEVQESQVEGLVDGTEAVLEGEVEGAHAIGGITEGHIGRRGRN